MWGIPVQALPTAHRFASHNREGHKWPFWKQAVAGAGARSTILGRQIHPYKNFI
jgi:hypothetical protein